MHEGVGQVLAGIQSSSEFFSDHEYDAGVAEGGFVEAQCEFVALADLSGEGRCQAEAGEVGRWFGASRMYWRR